MISKPLNKGLFISFEGGEGTGKSTQIKLLAEKLEGKGYDVVVTREPGGTPEAEKIRNLLVQRDGGDWSPMAESLLFFAARNMHVEDKIKPALNDGTIVLSDRFTDSTRAYQSYGYKKISLDVIERLNTLALGNFGPDMTFILDIPVKKGLARANERLIDNDSTEDRFEGLQLEFHEGLRQGFLDIAERDEKRCRVIDADRSIEDIADDIERIALEKLKSSDVSLKLNP